MLMPKKRKNDLKPAAAMSWGKNWLTMMSGKTGEHQRAGFLILIEPRKSLRSSGQVLVLARRGLGSATRRRVTHWQRFGSAKRLRRRKSGRSSRIPHCQ
jgi:hypothetical protein